MKIPAKPLNEKSRLEALWSMKILDTPAEERFDRLTRLARRLFGVPIAQITLIDEDRQWFKSLAGLKPIMDAAPSQIPRDLSFCAHAILGDQLFVVPDMALDERFHDNPLVADTPRIRFYAGSPLSVANGCRIGTLCVLDLEPRLLSDEDQGLLIDLGRMVEQEIAAGHLATMDELTALSNRRGFRALAQHAVNVCKRDGKPAWLFFFDLNRFKQINDEYGHCEGDQVLARFGDALRSAFRESDVVGRIGGDEFAVLLTNADLLETANVLTRLDAAIRKLNANGLHGYTIEYSVGVTTLDHARHLSVDDLIQEADSLMYVHKKKSALARFN